VDSTKFRCRWTIGCSALLNSINISISSTILEIAVGCWALESTRRLNGDLRLIDTFGVINLPAPGFNTSYRANFRGEARKLACLAQPRHRSTDRRERFPQRKPNGSKRADFYQIMGRTHGHGPSAIVYSEARDGWEAVWGIRNSRRHCMHAAWWLPTAGTGQGQPALGLR
jgi:hypothetical protein